MEPRNTNHRNLKTIFKLTAAIVVIVVLMVLMQYALNEEVAESTEHRVNMPHNIEQESFTKKQKGIPKNAF